MLQWFHFELPIRRLSSCCEDGRDEDPSTLVPVTATLNIQIHWKPLREVSLEKKCYSGRGTERLLGQYSWESLAPRSAADTLSQGIPIITTPPQAFDRQISRLSLDRLGDVFSKPD